MRVEKLRQAIFEANRFLKAAEALMDDIGDKECGYIYDYSPKKRGAAKRSSMDLTRALAELRQS